MKYWTAEYEIITSVGKLKLAYFAAAHVSESIFTPKHYKFDQNCVFFYVHVSRIFQDDR